MNISVNSIPSEELEVGMILAKDIVIENTVLLHKDTVLNKTYIKKLRELLPFYEVSIISNEHDTYSEKEYPLEELKYKNISLNRRKKAEKIKQEIEEINNKMKSVIRDITLDKTVEITEIGKVSKELIKEFNSDNDFDLISKSLMQVKGVDEYLYKHSVNVGIISGMIGKWLGLKPKELKELVDSALLHDIGKIMLDKQILNKTEPLKTEEYNYLKNHSKVGYIQLIKSGAKLNIAYAVLMHHERFDGSGYPLGFKEDRIHPYSKIIAVADVFDAMTSDRCYKKRKTLFESLEELKKCSLKELDPDICNKFINRMISLYTGEYGILNTGDVCKIIKFDIYNISKPLVLMGDDFIDLSNEKHLKIIDII